MNAAPDLIDLGRSLPPLVPEVGAALAVALQALAAEAEPGLILHRAEGSGSARDRAAAAIWLARRLGPGIDPDRIVIASGTQILVRLLLEHHVAPGAAALAESLSYGVVRAIADLARIRLVGLPIDADGLIPDAIERAAGTSGARLIFCNPTLHNPTASIMPLERRLRIAGIARRLGLTIIEDDVLGPLHPEAPPPIAAIAPDITWYIQSTAKTLAHGMRIAYALAPSPARMAAVIEPVRRLSFWAPAPLGLAVLTRWIETGQAAAILASVRAEAATRMAIARDALIGLGAALEPGAFHVWLPTGALAGSRFAAAAAECAVTVRPARAFAVEHSDDDPPFVRLSLSSPRVRSDVRIALERLRGLSDAG